MDGPDAPSALRASPPEGEERRPPSPLGEVPPKGAEGASPSGQRSGGFAHAFIDKPIFAGVLAILIALGGLLALFNLPVAQYPSVAPPSISISYAYPGADAQTLDDNVTSLVEQELNGLNGLLYLSSSSTADGSATTTVTFKTGTDIQLAQVDLQNRVARVQSRLPQEVVRQGILIDRAARDFLLIIGIYSPDQSHDRYDLGNITTTRVLDQIRRVQGVGDAVLFGSEYAMRIWLDPAKLTGYNLSPADALNAVREQNAQTAGGSIGALPSPPGTQLAATVVTPSRLTSPEQFRAIILKANPDGSTVRLGDVARVELGAANYNTAFSVNGKPGAGIAIRLQPGSNALQTGKLVKAKMAELARTLPSGVTWTVPYDSTLFVEVSIREVVKTLAEAVVLVFLVMLLFLQSLRATIIPTVVVPVALGGACLGLYLLGYSINVLTLFGMVLAIGILVDDAIVVIENVERIMHEEGLSPRDATAKAMGQITGAVIGITLVLTAVFLPMAFFPGSVGAIYRQFSVTLVLSMAFSAFLALSLTPALCALLLQNQPRARRGFFAAFNRRFSGLTRRYSATSKRMVARPRRWLVAFALLSGLMAILFARLPGGYLPAEDAGYIITAIQLPAGATQERTKAVRDEVLDYYAHIPEQEQRISILGFSFFGSGQNIAQMFIRFKPWDQRPGKDHGSLAIVDRAAKRWGSDPRALIVPVNPPPIRELGNATGFAFRLQDRGGQGYEALVAARGQLLGMASKDPAIVGARPEGQEVGPQVKVVVDRIKARALGLDIADINNTLSIAFGSAYANDFNRQGRVLRVLMQADAPQRLTPDDILQLRVRGPTGAMVPFSAFTTADWTAGPQQLDRYNGYPALSIAGNAAPGHSTGEAIAAMARFAKQLPPGFDFEWTATSYEEVQSAGQLPLLLALSLLIVFLVLAALYESWAVPLAVILIVPLGVLGALVAADLRGLQNDVYFKIGLIAIIGLSAKNAVLIIEFAKQLQEEGLSTIAAIEQAVRLRFRPIVMTSLAFILGVAPLVFSAGAGATSRQAIGTGVMGGMIFATALGLLFVPVFFVSIMHWIVQRREPRPEPRRA